MAIEKVNLKSLVESFKSVASPKHREDTLPKDTLPKVIQKSHEASNSSLVEANKANEKPSLWQRVKLNAQKLSHFTSEFAKRHPDVLKAAGVATAVAVVAGVLLASRKSMSVGSPVAQKKSQSAEPTSKPSNVSVEPKNVEFTSLREFSSFCSGKFQDLKNRRAKNSEVPMRTLLQGEIVKFAMNHPLHVAAGAVALLMTGKIIIEWKNLPLLNIEDKMLNTNVRSEQSYLTSGVDRMDFSSSALNTNVRSKQSYLTSGVDRMDPSSSAPTHFLNHMNSLVNTTEQKPDFKMGQAFHRAMVLLKEAKTKQPSNIVIPNSAGQASPPQSPTTATLSPASSRMSSQLSLSQAGSPPNSPSPTNSSSSSSFDPPPLQLGESARFPSRMKTAEWTQNGEYFTGSPPSPLAGQSPVASSSYDHSLPRRFSFPIQESNPPQPRSSVSESKRPQVSPTNTQVSHSVNMLGQSTTNLGDSSRAVDMERGEDGFWHCVL